MPEVQLASPAVMEKLAALDESFPEVIRACARESAQTERELWARREANAEQNMRKRGICVTELDDAEKSSLPRSGAAHVRWLLCPAGTDRPDTEKLKKTPREVPGWTFFGVLFFAMNAGMYPTGQ